VEGPYRRGTTLGRARQLELKAQGDVHPFFENLRKHPSEYKDRIVRTLPRNALTQPKR
jgi:hypothetical protein